jgi:hypothetical protein
MAQSGEMRRFLQLSLLLNVALLCVYWGRGGGHEQIGRQPRSTVGMPIATGLKRAHNGTTSIQQPSSSWQQIYPSDPARFVSNLRAIGCPEQTIRDIVVLQICRDYRKRILALEAESARNWDYRREHTDSKELDLRRRDLRDEMITGVESLFGKQWTSVSGSLLGWPNRDDGMGFLSMENRGQLRELDRKYRNQIDELERKQLTGTFDPESRARLMELRLARQADLASMLSPQQLEEYQLYRSDAAVYVRDSLPSAKSEAEFRTMVRVAEEFGPGAWSGPREGPADSPDDSVREFQKQKAAFQERLKQVLGEDRIAEQEQEEQARAEEEERERKQQREEHERAEFASLADEAGVPPADFARFFDKLKRSEDELRPKFEELENSLTGTPEEKYEKMKAAVRGELEKIAGDTLGANAAAMVDKLMQKIDEDKPH